jgi:VWFA-related protein
MTMMMRSFVIFVSFVSLLGAPRQDSQTQAQQRPVFRGGTHFVRVDAYPTSADGKVIEGLRPEDFEIVEDGKRQAIDSFDFIRFDTFTPEAERRDPISKQAGFDLAADPRYRVFVVYVDLFRSGSAGAFSATSDLPKVEQPLINFFERVIGPKDLYALLTSHNSAKDLVLAQKTTVTVSQINDLFRAKVIERDDADEVLDSCPPPPPPCVGFDALKPRFRTDVSYTNLMNVAAQLGSLRQERKNLVLVTNLLPRWGADRSLYEALVTCQLGGISKNGIQNGRITSDNREIYTTGDPRGANKNVCMNEVDRLALMNFDTRYRELLEEARRQNVSVYVITPGGLQAPPAVTQQQSMKSAYDDLKALAENTGGIAVTDTNDLNAAFRRIADDLAAYYLLGYYTTNTKFDGGVRKLTVKVNGKTIRARREYRAPTEAELAAMAAPRPAAAPEDTGPPAVIGEPVAYRVSRTQPAEQSRLLEFVRADRLRVAWPVLAPLDRREARMLDSAGKPMAFDLPVSESADGKTILVELVLAPFGRGVYSIELTAASAGKTERRRLTFTMK